MSQGRYSTFDLRVRAVEAVERGLAVGQVADTFGIDRTTLFRWMARYGDGGLNGLARRQVSGRPRLLDDLDKKALWEIVLKPATAFGFETDLWTIGRLHRVVQEEYATTISHDTIWRRLRDAGLTYQKPERQYFEMDEEAREEWMQAEAPRIRRTVKKYRAFLYFQDEANVSLTAFLGKTWAPRGLTPRQKVTGKRGGVAAISAINGSGRLLFKLHEKRICSGEVIAFLGQMLKHHKKRHLVVVMDQAPPHTSKKTMGYIESQARLHVFHLPKYSPDWNPDEKVWNHLKHQELKGHQAKTKTELKKMTQNKLTTMSRNPSLLRGIFFRCCVAELFG
ncbi:MAG: IS630 family transposase [Nitrososphaera sp.]|nr:IS630 family transposase [Nitrososphaera sp.]